jgi:GT2 family glycosyltransferase
MLLPIKPVSFEITSSADVVVGSEAKSARVLVGWKGVPMGIMPVPVTAGRVRAEDVKSLAARHLAGPFARELCRRGLLGGGIGGRLSISEKWDAPPAELAGALPSISVAICTRDRPEDLAACLASIAALSMPPHEVLIVDNAPATQATAKLVAQRFPQFRYICESVPGLDHARNRAIREATGEVIAYTDDDVVVEADWTAALAAAFAADPAVGLITGLIEPLEQETPAQVWFERYGGFGRGCQRYYQQLKRGAPLAWNTAGAGRLGAGANMAVRRKIFDEIGHFDPALDVGTPTRGGGDHEIFFRLLRSGWICLYEPTAVVRHRHRRTMPELAGLLFNYGHATRCFFERVVLDFPTDRAAIRQLTRWWWKNWALGRWVSSALCPDRFPPELVMREIEGFLRGRGGYMRARTSIVKDEISRCDQFNVKPASPAGRRAVGLAMVEIDRPLRTLTEGSQCETLEIIVGWQGRPLGQFKMPSMGAPVSVARLADALAARFTSLLLEPSAVGTDLAWAGFHAELGKCLRPAPKPKKKKPSPSVSIIVGTCERPDALRRCLDSLQLLRYPGKVEIIVVDNRPHSPRAAEVAAVAAAFPTVSLLAEPRPGSSYARNAGVAAASGEIIAMTDDDMVVAPEWLDGLVEPFGREDVFAVTGNTLAAGLETQAERDFEQYGGFCRGFARLEFNERWFFRTRRRAVPTWKIGGSGNMAFRRSTFSHPEIGGFLPTLGAGVPAGVGEDTLLFYQILRAGGTIIYEPAAIAWHHHRVTRHELQRQIMAYSKGHIAYHLITWAKYRDRRALNRVLVELPTSLAARVLQRLRRKNSYPLRLLATEVAGTLLGPWALWRSHRHFRKHGPGVLPATEAVPAPEAATRPNHVVEVSR